MKLYQLKNKLVLRLAPKAGEFLKAYSSNTLDRPRNAFLDIQGKIVATFDQCLLNDDEVLIVIEKQFLNRVQTHLKVYLSLSDVNLNLKDTLIYYDLEGDWQTQAPDLVIREKGGSLVLTDRKINSNVSDEDFTLWRLKNNSPIQGIDYDEELLLNVGEEEFISFTKGCYLGQEIIARVHHRSKPPKRLVVRAKSECSPEEWVRATSKVLDPETKTHLGFVFLKV